MHDDDGRSICVQTLPQAAQIEREAAWLTVGEPHASACVNDRGRCREERVGRDDHLSVLHSDRPEDDLEGAGAAVYGNRVRHLAKGCELFLELPAVLAKSKRSCRQALTYFLGNIRYIFVRK